MLFRVPLLFISLFIVACSEPDFTDHRGNSGNFDALGGRWMIINYWATWCKPCKVALFGVEFDQSQGQKLQENIAKLNIEFPVLLNDPAVMLGFKKPMALPTTFVFNPEGELHVALKGPQTSATLLAAISD